MWNLQVSTPEGEEFLRKKSFSFNIQSFRNKGRGSTSLGGNQNNSTNNLTNPNRRVTPLVAQPTEEQRVVVRVAEANSEPTTGEGARVPLPNNDKLKHSGVEHRIQFFGGGWLAEGCSDIVCCIVTNGYIFPFRKKPPLTRQPVVIGGYQNLLKDQALYSSIKDVLLKQAIEIVHHRQSLGYYTSSWSQNQKTSGGWS